MIEFKSKPDHVNFQRMGNNCIFEFRSRSVGEASAFAAIQVGYMNFTIYPDLSGDYYFNVKNAVRVLVENKNLSDIEDYSKNTVTVDIGIFIYDRNSNQIDYFEQSYTFIPAYLNLDELLYNIPKTELIQLTPKKLPVYIGYPHFFYYIKDGVVHRDSSHTNGGFEIEISEKLCGTYVKFLCRKGGYVYFLLDKGKEFLDTKDLGELFNDFTSVGRNESPYLQVGKIGRKRIAASSGILQEWENEVLKDILVSPKIYMFVIHKWIEVALKDGSTKTKDNKRNGIEYMLTFELPPENNLTL